MFKLHIKYETLVKIKDFLTLLFKINNTIY